MRPTRSITAMLLVTAFGIAGCSKRDQPSATQAAPDVAQTKPVTTTPVKSPGAKQIGEEGFETKALPKITGSFADGKAAYEAKKYADATSIFESYIERKPGNAWGYYMLGLSAWKNGDLAKSEKAFDQALSIDPHHVKSLMNMSRVFLEQKRYDEAAERLALASEIDPGSSEVFRLLGRTYHAQGKTNMAIDAYQHALDLNERDAWAMNNLGLVLLEAKRADDALPLFAKAVELRKDVPEFQNNLAMAKKNVTPTGGDVKAPVDEQNASR